MKETLCNLMVSGVPAKKVVEDYARLWPDKITWPVQSAKFLKPPLDKKRHDNRHHANIVLRQLLESISSPHEEVSPTPPTPTAPMETTGAPNVL